MNGRKDRISRLVQPKPGVWGTTSSDLLFVAGRLFQLSKTEAESSRFPDKNHSRYVYAGIPLLLAAVRSFAIEYEGIGHLGPLPAELANDSTCNLLKSRYGVSGALLTDLADLTEIRNEIIHPIPRPTGTPDNWPDYLRHIKQKGLLSTTGVPNSDYIMLGQIASHKLFVWAVDLTKRAYEAIIDSDPSKRQQFELYLKMFDTLFG